MNSSFLKEDVVLLLKDITGLVEPLPTQNRETLIQGGIHYSEMLPLEYKPTETYLQIYERMLDVFGQATADAVARVSDLIATEKGKNVVVVSLVRAGTPVGVLIRRYIRKKYGFKCPHYSISIIRDRGIDRNAINYILKNHSSESIQFVDGWTGKGIIYNELRKAISEYDGISNSLAVLADPANITDLCGTHEDILIPSSCLNSTVCGLISRSLLRKDIIKGDDFHGAAFYRELLEEDRTYEFIDYIESKFTYNLQPNATTKSHKSGLVDVEYLAKKYSVHNVNFIKPGIGETTRVLLRRIPWIIIIDERYKKSKELDHIKQLANEKHVRIEYDTLKSYKCCGLIKNMTDV